MSTQTEETLKMLADQMARLVAMMDTLADRMERAERSLRATGVVLDQHELDIQKIRRGEP